MLEKLDAVWVWLKVFFILLLLILVNMPTFLTNKADYKDIQKLNQAYEGQVTLSAYPEDWFFGNMEYNELVNHAYTAMSLIFNVQNNGVTTNNVLEYTNAINTSMEWQKYRFDDSLLQKLQVVMAQLSKSPVDGAMQLQRILMTNNAKFHSYFYGLAYDIRFEAIYLYYVLMISGIVIVCTLAGATIYYKYFDTSYDEDEDEDTYDEDDFDYTDFKEPELVDEEFTEELNERYNVTVLK